MVKASRALGGVNKGRGRSAGRPRIDDDDDEGDGVEDARDDASEAGELVAAARRQAARARRGRCCGGAGAAARAGRRRGRGDSRVRRAPGRARFMFPGHSAQHGKATLHYGKDSSTLQTARAVSHAAHAKERL